DARSSGLPARYPLLGPRDQLPKIIEEIQPHRLLVALAQQRGRLSAGVLLRWRAAGMVIEHAAEFYERLAGKVALEWLWPSALIYGRAIQVSPMGNAVRRSVSLLVAVVGLVVCAPALALIALAIRLDSVGPIFFVQRRLGARGRAFSLVKFRTMHPGTSDHSQWAC